MSIIEPNRRDVIHPQHIKKNSATLRLWHWLNALVITGSLLTVLVNSTLLENKAGPKLANGNSRQLIHGLRDQVWSVHTYLGYTLAALLLFRLGLEFFQLADQKLLHKLKSAFQKYQTIKKQREPARHEFWVKTIYTVFYLMLLTMVATGLCFGFRGRRSSAQIYPCIQRDPFFYDVPDPCLYHCSYCRRFIGRKKRREWHCFRHDQWWKE